MLVCEHRLFKDQTNGIQKRLGLVEATFQLFDPCINLVRRRPDSVLHANDSVRSIRTPHPGPRGLKPLAKSAHHRITPACADCKTWGGTSSSNVNPILCLTMLSSIPCPRVKEPPEAADLVTGCGHGNEDSSTVPTATRDR